MPDPDDLSTQELRAIQDDRRTREAAAAREAEDPQAERTHARRADKAAYLAEKLAEQEETLEE